MKKKQLELQPLSVGWIDCDYRENSMSDGAHRANNRSEKKKIEKNRGETHALLSHSVLNPSPQPQTHWSLHHLFAQTKKNLVHIQ